MLALSPAAARGWSLEGGGVSYSPSLVVRGVATEQTGPLSVFPLLPHPLGWEVGKRKPRPWGRKRDCPMAMGITMGEHNP